MTNLPNPITTLILLAPALFSCETLSAIRRTGEDIRYMARKTGQTAEVTTAFVGELRQTNEILQAVVTDARETGAKTAAWLKVALGTGAVALLGSGGAWWRARRNG